MSEVRVLGSAADLKFQQWVPQLGVRNFESISGTAMLDPARVLFPKFA